MGTKKQELEPNIILKHYWSNNDQFADLFNAVIFHGRQVIKPEDLEEVDTEEGAVFADGEYEELIDVSSEIIKVQKLCSGQGFQIVMLGLEHQEQIYFAKSMRVKGYDYACYKQQYNRNARRYKIANRLNEDEYLPKMKKTDKFVPAITIVLYYGKNSWNGVLPIYEILNTSKEKERYVDNYKIVLVEVKENNLILHNINNQDLFNLLCIVLNKNLSKNEVKKKALRYIEKYKPDESVITALIGVKQKNEMECEFSFSKDKIKILY